VDSGEQCDDGNNADCDGCSGSFCQDAGQADTDLDGASDLCDICPADAADLCDADGSAAEEISVEEGGTLETPDGALTLEVDPGDVAGDTTLSVTQTVSTDPEVDLTLGPNPGLGQALAVYDLEPDGIVFENPVTLTIIADVSSLNANLRDRLDLYILTDTDGDLVPDTFVSIGAICSVLEEPTGTFTATCTAEVTSFSTFALLAPLDSDGDGVPDLFGELVDSCPSVPTLATTLDYAGDMVVATDAAGIATVTLSGVLQDGNGSPIVNELVNASLADANGNFAGDCVGTTDASGVASCNVRSLALDVYAVSVVHDGVAGCFLGSADDAFVVVFDPTQPRATGGGFILPDAESTLPAVSASDKANFGFVVRIDKNQAAAGNLEFQYRTAGIKLKSETMSWYTVSNIKAMFQGEGTINGVGFFTFRVSATDGDLSGNQPDAFDIWIWNGVDTEGDPVHRAKNDLAGGSIVIHRR